MCKEISKKKRIGILIMATILTGGMLGCQRSDHSGREENKPEGTVTLAAAASLEYAFEEELIPQFEKQNPEVTIEGVYDSSGKLQQQIEAGLAADLFFSASPTQMQALEKEGMIADGTVRNLLENKMVLIVPEDFEGEIASFEEVAGADSIAIGDPASVPAGQYAKEVLTALGIWEQVSEKASFGTNVTEVLNWVAEASADCGIVYATDAATTKKVQVVDEAPEGALESPVLYPVAITKDAPNSQAAKAFYEFLLSDDAMAVFQEYGFADHREEKE